MRLKSLRFVFRGASAAIAAVMAFGALFGGAGIAFAAVPTTTIGTSITTTGTISGDGSLLTNLNKTQVGLGNVDNLQQMPLSYLDTDFALTADSDAKVASQKATKKYVDDHDALKADKVTSAVNGHFAGLNANGNLIDSGFSSSSFLATSGGTMTGALAMGGFNIAGAGSITATSFSGALSGNAATSSALAANPTDCSANTFATAIAANGNLTCNGVADGALSSNVLLRGTPQQMDFKDLIDSSVNYIDDGDATKKMAFQLSGVTSGTTRTLTVPDASGTIMLSSTPISGGSLATGSVLATKLQNAPADLGAANVLVDLTNNNGSFNTNLKLDGMLSASSLQSLKVLATDSSNLVRFDSATIGGQYFTMANADPAAPVTLGADGTDTNISIRLMPKGLGSVVIGGEAIRLPVHSTDPSGTSGMVYFNGTTNALRCFSTTWGDCSTAAVSSSEFSNGGDATGADLTLGTNDGFSVRLETVNVARLILDTAGKATFTGTLQVDGSSNFRGDVVLGTSSAHLVSKQSTPPTASSDTAAVVTVQIGSTDIAGTLSTDANAYTMLTLTFATAYENPPSCVISAANLNAAEDAADTYVTTTSATMVVHNRSSFGDSFTYHCIGH